MLASLGFISAALLFSVYAASATAINKSGPLKLGYFAAAYFALTAACIAWGIGALVGTESSLKSAVLIGNLFLMVATVLLIYSTIKGQFRIPATVLAGVGAIGFMVTRIFALQPEPYLKEDVLIFNTQKPLAYILVTVFVLIWLPLMMRFVRIVTQANTIGFLTSAGIVSALVATLGVISFLAANTVSLIILSFTVLCCAYIPLIYINILAGKKA